MRGRRSSAIERELARRASPQSGTEGNSGVGRGVAWRRIVQRERPSREWRERERREPKKWVEAHLVGRPNEKGVEGGVYTTCNYRME